MTYFAFMAGVVVGALIMCIIAATAIGKAFKGQHTRRGKNQ